MHVSNVCMLLLLHVIVILLNYQFSIATCAQIFPYNCITFIDNCSARLQRKGSLSSLMSKLATRSCVPKSTSSRRRTWLIWMMARMMICPSSSWRGGHLTSPGPTRHGRPSNQQVILKKQRICKRISRHLTKMGFCWWVQVHRIMLHGVMFMFQPWSTCWLAASAFAYAYDQQVISLMIVSPYWSVFFH